MRKRKWKQGIAVLTAAALVLTGITVPGSAGAKAKIRLNKKKVTIKVGGKVTLKLKNAKKKVIWKSSKKKVASVSAKGIVRGKSAGTAKITAKSNKKSYTCTVIVKEKRDSFVEPDETEMPGTTVPTAKPTGEPTKTPVNPTSNPTKAPASEAPVNPTSNPTKAPASEAPVNPTSNPTKVPASETPVNPTSNPTKAPASEAPVNPTSNPTKTPASEAPVNPTSNPTKAPASEAPVNPTSNPTKAPASEAPVNPTKAPVNPTKEPVDPTPEPTTAPTAAPSGNTLTIGKYSLSIGMSFQDAQNILGSKCVDEGISPQGYASYIYNPGNDYSCLVELQVKDGKLVELSTISKNFNYGDIAAAGNSIATLKANGFTAVETYKYTIYSKTSDQEYINVMTDAQRGGAVYGVQIFDKSLGSMDTLLYPKNCKYSDDINKYQARLTALYLNAYRAYHGAGLMQITDNGVAQAHSEYMASKNSDVMDEGSVSWKTRFDQNYNDGEKLFLKTEYVSYGSPDAFSAVTYAIAERDSTTNFYKYILMEEYEDEAVDFCIECGFANTASGSKLTFSAFDFYAY
ncbi:MAG: Ig-like domain-containing protein [Roseburia sp.]|nr:Ig-like domain-containing protein [Roseburia sp.]